MVYRFLSLKWIVSLWIWNLSCVCDVQFYTLGAFSWFFRTVIRDHVIQNKNGEIKSANGRVDNGTGYFMWRDDSSNNCALDTLNTRRRLATLNRCLGRSWYVHIKKLNLNCVYGNLRCLDQAKIYNKPD